MKKYSSLVMAAITLMAVAVMAGGPPKGAPTDKDPAAYKGLNPDQMKRLQAGEVVILDHPENIAGRKMITAALLFDQDIDTVWTLMTSGWRQSEYLPRLKESKLIKKWEGHDILELHVDMMGIAIKYQILGDRNKSKYHSSWKLNPEFDNDMKEVSGFWQLYWIDDKHTLGRYGTWIETGLWIPQTIQDYMTKRDLPESLGAVKKWIDSNGTYRKP